MDVARKGALQASFLGALGLGAYALRCLSREALHPLVAERTTLVKRYPALCACVSKLHTLGDERALATLVDKLGSIAELDAARGPAAQWQISRLSAEVVREARDMCRRANTAGSDEVFRAVLTCTDEVVPQVQGHLDDLLHNHLLARDPLA